MIRSHELGFTADPDKMSEPAASRRPTASQEAANICRHYGLRLIAEGITPSGRGLIVVNRLDPLSLVATLALVPGAEAMITPSQATLALDLAKQRSAWAPLIIGPKLWSLLRSQWKEEAIFASVALEPTALERSHFEHIMRVRFAGETIAIANAQRHVSQLRPNCHKSLSKVPASPVATSNSSLMTFPLERY